MFLDGGVAGAEPLHKGGRLRPTAHKTKGRSEEHLCSPHQGRELIVAETLRIFLAGEIGRYESTQ